MKLKVKLSAGLLLLCLACTNVKETPKGMTYTIVRKGDGVVAKPGQFLIYSIVFKDAKDSIWYDSRKSDFPEPLRLPDTSVMKKEEGLGELFRYLSKGDSVTLKIKATDLYSKTMKAPIPPKVDPKSDFSFAIGVKDIISEEQFMAMKKEIMEKEKVKMLKTQSARLAKDTVSIDSFLRVQKIKPLKTASGLRYVVVKQGTGPLVQKGNTVKLDYAGYLMSGKYFDTSIESVAKAHNINRPSFNPFEVQAGGGRVIPGFDEAFSLMSKGEKITVYIPSTLAYGPQKAGADIGPNSIIIFDIDMLDTNVAKPVKK